MNYVQHLYNTYKGSKALTLGESVEEFLVLYKNKNSEMFQFLDFNRLESVFSLLVPNSVFKDFICKKLSPLNGRERYSIVGSGGVTLMVVYLLPNSIKFNVTNLTVHPTMVEGLMTLVFLSHLMQRNIAVSVFPQELRIMS